MYIYSVFLTLFLHLFQLQSPKRAIPSGALFSILKEYILNGLMADASVRNQIHHAVEQNKSYKSTSFITPSSGTGLTWETVCDRTGRLFFSYHNFGDGGHGPLSTVDSRVDHKFVRIDDRENMVIKYGEDRVGAWEEYYLNGSSFDDFNRSPGATEWQHSETPFYSEGYWYLPEFCPNYNFGNDNLIILDGTSNRFIDQALDELSTYGCRYARIVTVTQDYFRLSGVKTELYSYQAGQVVFLTAVKNWAGKYFPIPDMFLPYAHNLVSTATASIASGKDPVFLQPEARERELFQSVFGLLGAAMLGIEISVRELTRNIIAALKSLSPLITKVEGYGRYRVKRIYDESELRTMLKPRREKHIGKQHIDEVISHFTILHEKGLSFFMLFPERETFQGDVLTPVYNYFDESGAGWQEALGTSWQSLAYDTLGIIESRTGFPLVEIPVMGRRSSEGRLYHFYVRYQEWDCSHPMMPQVTVTLEAMQKGLTAMRQRSPGYIMMVNRFNEELVRYDIVWEDWLIVLVLRSMLMRKMSEELGRLIAERTVVLLEDLYGYTNQENLQIVKEDITAVWDRIRISPENDDDKRWETLHRLLSEGER